MSHITGVAGGVIWQKYTLPYTSFQIAALTNSVPVITLQPRTVVMAGLLKQSVTFVGSGISALGITLGVSGNTAKYAISLNALGTVSDSSFSTLTGAINDLQGFTTGVSLLATATALGANLSALTAGSLDVYLLCGQLPA